MYGNITIEREAPDKLSKSVWAFWLSDRLILWLDGYRELSRPTRRHNYNAVTTYSRLDSRDRTIKTPDDIPIPPDVEAEAIQQVVDQLKVAKWVHTPTRY